MNKNLLYALTAGATLLLTPSLYAATTSLTLEADTYIRGSSANSNYSSDSQVIVGTTSPDRLHGLLRFNFTPITSSLGPGQTIDVTSVQLNTTNTNSSGNGTPTLAVYSYAFDFVATSATWNNPATGDSTNGGTLGTELSSTSGFNNGANETDTFASTTAFVDAVQAAFSGSDPINLILARDPDNSGSNSFTRFAAGSSGFDLQVTYDIVAIPEPSAALLGGLGCLMLLRRRRNG